jgi:hypothetical protein
MPDYYNIAVAIGTRFLALTPPTGLTAIQGATALTPNNIPDTPYLIVELPGSADDATVGNGMQTYVDNWDLYFLLNKASGELPVDKERLLKWLPVLITATYGQMALGATAYGLTKSYVASYEYGVYRYGGKEWHAWHLVLRTWSGGTAALAA